MSGSAGRADRAPTANARARDDALDEPADERPLVAGEQRLLVGVMKKPVAFRVRSGPADRTVGRARRSSAAGRSSVHRST